MESALMTTPPCRSASASASADLPLAVGPAMSMVVGVVTVALAVLNPIAAATKPWARPSAPPIARPRVVDQTVSCAPSGPQPRRRGAGAALRRALERRGARARRGQAVELSAHLQAGDRPRSEDRPLRPGGLCQGVGEP